MGALKGPIAVRRYVVTDPLPAKVRERLVKGMRAHKFVPLDPKAELDATTGWVTLFDNNDADLTSEKVFFPGVGGEQLRVSLRSDVLKPPPAELKRQLAIRVAEFEAKEDRQLARAERRALKDEVARSLRQRAFPRVRTHDVVWDLEARRVWFWSQTKAANEAFLDLFIKSFGVRLEVEGPARWARSLVDAAVINRLEPTRELWMGFAGVRPLSTGTDVGDDGGA